MHTDFSLTKRLSIIAVSLCIVCVVLIVLLGMIEISTQELVYAPNSIGAYITGMHQQGIYIVDIRHNVQFRLVDPFATIYRDTTISTYPHNPFFVPEWSPDGSQLLFTTGSTYMINADGSDAYELTTAYRTTSSARWSPDGTHIAFFSDMNGFVDIYVLDIQNQIGRKLTGLFLSFGSSLAWSADGSRIAFVAGTGLEWAVFTVEVATGDMIRLASLGNIQTPFDLVRWSPDNWHVAVSVHTPTTDDIVVLNVENRTIQRINTAIEERLIGWQTNDTLLFASDMNQNGFELFTINIQTQEILPFESAIPLDIWLASPSFRPR